MAVYAASKAAIKLLTQVLAQEVGNRGITVNTITPGPTVPGMFANLPLEAQQQAAASSPFNRVGTPQDIADIIAFVVSEEARWLTGEEICANGGAKIWPLGKKHKGSSTQLESAIPSEDGSLVRFVVSKITVISPYIY